MFRHFTLRFNNPTIRSEIIPPQTQSRNMGFLFITAIPFPVMPPILLTKINPSTRNGSSAGGTTLAFQVYGQHLKSSAFNQKVLTIGTISILCVFHLSRQITGIHKLKPSLLAMPGSSQQGVHRGAPSILHFIVWMKCRHMPGDGRRNSTYKFSHFGQLFI